MTADSPGVEKAMTAASSYPSLADVYRDLHAHPELAFQETRTADIVAKRLESLGFETTTGVGGTGVVGVLHNGPGSVVLLRADMDALAVQEETGLPYASTPRTKEVEEAEEAEDQSVPVMHACGHDMHVTCLLGAAADLVADSSSWQGTLLLVFQPAEETGRGAQAMIDDGLYERFGHPAVVLGQHVAPLPAGTLGLRTGPVFAASDAIEVVLHGSDAHGSRPQASVDPVLMAAATVIRLQGIVSREVAPASTAVVTVSSLHAGTQGNVITDQAELRLSVRTFDATVRGRILDAIERIVRAEATASKAPKAPDISVTVSLPAVVNDTQACDRIRDAFIAAIGSQNVIEPSPTTGSDDVGLLAQAAGAPCVYWLLGGADPGLFSHAQEGEDMERIARGLAWNHSPDYAPVIEPTLSTGIIALGRAARLWLSRTPGQSE